MKSLDVRHVLMTADAVGGVWTYALELAKGLGAHGVRTTLAVMGPAPSEAALREAASIPELDVRHAPFKLEWMPDAWADVDAASDWLLGLAAEVRPDLVHLNGFAHAALPWDVPNVCVVHSDVASWWKAVKGVPAPADEWAEYRRRVRSGLRAASAVVAPTQAMLDAAIEEYGPIANASVIYNGRQPMPIVGVGKRPMIFGAGRLWDEAKNVAALERAAPHVEWPIYVAGDAQPPEGERRRVPGLNLLGKLPPDIMHAWYGRASVFALPARYEPFGLCVLEAALARCALVLGDIPSLRELWDGAALFVPPDDDQALAAALNRLAGNEGERQEMAVKARERAASYSARTMACNYLFLYQDLKQATALDFVGASPSEVSLL
jgi:glycogen synthase